MRKWPIDELIEDTEKPFIYSKYEACSIMYLDEEFIHFSPDTLRFLSYNGTEVTALKNPMKISACCIYNEDKTRLLKWGHDAFKGKKLLKNGEVYLDNFLTGLHRLYKKLEQGQDFDDQDIFLSNTVAKCFKLFVVRLRKLWIPATEDIKNKTEFHFVFVVPTEWVPEIREKLLRPIFIQAGIINETDHPDRLQFYTKLECHLQMAQVPRREIFRNFISALKKERRGIQLELDLKSNNIISLILDIFEAKNSTLASKSTLIPKVIRSTSTKVVDWEGIRNNLEQFLRTRGVFTAETKDVQIKLDQILTVLSNYYLEQKVEGGINITNNKIQFPYKDSCVDEWELTDTQKDSIKSIDMAKVYQLLFLPVVTMIMAELEGALTYSNYSEKRPVMLPLLSVSYGTKRDYDLYYYSKNDDEEEEHNEDYFTRKAIFFFSNCIIAVVKEEAHQLFYDLKIPNNEDNILTPRYVIMGASSILTRKIITANMLSQPSIIDLGTKAILPNKYLSKLQPDIIVNIDLSYTKVSYSCAILNINHRVKDVINNDDTDADERLNPPKKFLSKFGICDNIGEIRVDKWIMDFVNNNFADALDYFSKYDRFTEQYQKGPLNTKNVITKNQEKLKNHYLLRDFFTEKKNLVGLLKSMFIDQQQKDSSSEIFVSKQQQRYVKVFLMIFLGFLKERINCQLKNKLGDLLKSSKISYLISVEKMFLDSYIGTEDNLKELTVASGILQKLDDPKKVQIITRGEGLISRLEKKLNIDLPLKSYYAQIQLHESHIQLTLYRLMKQSSTQEEEEEAAAIIIMDKVISTENMYTSLGRYVWNSVQLHLDLVHYCTKHEQRQELESFVDSIGNYKHFAKLFKRHIQKNLASHDLDLCSKIELSSKCKCHINITSREIIEIAIKPILKSTVSVLFAVLSNRDYFGHYDVSHLFIMNSFADNIESPAFKKVLDMEIENIWADFAYEKRIEVQCTVLDQSITELTQQTIGELPFLSDCFTRGRLYQVSSKIYALRFGLGSIRSGEKVCFDQVSYKNDGCGHAITIPDNSYSIIFLNEGQVIPNEGITKTIYFKPNRDIIKEEVYINLLDYPYVSLRDLVDRKDIISYRNSYAQLAQVSNTYIEQWASNLPVPLTIRIRPNNNHNFSLHFSVQFPCYNLMINDRDSQSFEIEQRLTLDYV